MRKSLNAGKVSVLVLTAVFAVVSFLLGSSLIKAPKALANGNPNPGFAITNITANCNGSGQVTYTGTIPNGGFTLTLYDQHLGQGNGFVISNPVVSTTITSGVSPVSYQLNLSGWTGGPHYRVNSNFNTKSDSLYCDDETPPVTPSCSVITANPAFAAGSKFSLGQTYTFTPTITGSPTSYLWSINPTTPALLSTTNTTTSWVAPSTPNPGVTWTLSLKLNNSQDTACSLSFLDPTPVIPGCTDRKATNYNPDATVNNGSCTYASSTPVPTPVPTPLSCSGDTHPDAAGKNCVSFQLGGAPQGGNGGGQVLGASTGPKVLGASTMAGTGTFTENLYLAIMTLGGTISAFGIKNFKKARQAA